MIYDVLKSEGEDESKLEEIQQTIKGKNFESKLEIAYKVLPKSLIVEGQNPLKLIFDDLSSGIHSKSEDECNDIAVRFSNSVEYVISELSGHLKNKSKFIDSIRSITNKK